MRSAVFVSGILKTPAAGYAYTIKADYIEVTFRNDLDKRAVIQIRLYRFGAAFFIRKFFTQAYSRSTDMFFTAHRPFSFLYRDFM